MAKQTRKQQYMKYACGKAYNDGYAKALKDAGLDGVNRVVELLKEK